MDSNVENPNIPRKTKDDVQYSLCHDKRKGEFDRRTELERLQCTLSKRLNGVSYAYEVMFESVALVLLSPCTNV